MTEGRTGIAQRGDTLVADLVAQRVAKVYRACVYCSTPCYGLACSSHRDLLQHDPHYYLLRLRDSGVQLGQSNAPDPEPRTEAAGAGAQSERKASR